MKKDWDSCNCSALRRLRGNLTTVYQYLMRGNKEDTARVFSVVFSDRTRGNRQNRTLQHKKIPFIPWRQLNTRTGFPEKSRSPHPGICSNPAWIQPSPTCPSWPSFEQPGGLNHLPRCLSNSTTLQCKWTVYFYVTYLKGILDLTAEAKQLLPCTVQHHPSCNFAHDADK